MKTKETYSMAKRFTDTEIWKKQRWFKRLTPEYKCVFFYIKDQCDHAGIWNIDVLSLCEDIGLESFDIHDFIAKCNKDFDKITGAPVDKIRFKLLGDNALWFTIFVRFQYEGKDFKVNPAVAAVKSAIEILKGYGILEEALSKGYLSLKEGLYNPYEGVKDIDKDIDKEKDKVLNAKKENFREKIREVASLTPGEYPKQMLLDFLEYWSEPNKSRTLLKWEMEDTWDLSRRLKRWRNTDDKFNKGKSQSENLNQGTFILGQKHNAAG